MTLNLLSYKITFTFSVIINCWVYAFCAMCYVLSVYVRACVLEATQNNCEDIVNSSFIILKNASGGSIVKNH